MRILVIVRRTPDSKATVRPLADGSAIDSAGLRFVCDPFDEFGVEQAVRLKEARKDGTTVTALGAGGAETAEVIRHAIAMGADAGALLTAGDLPPHDELSLAAALADAVDALTGARGAFDLVFCGKQAIDNDSGELGPALAELLGLTHIGAATKLEVAPDGARVRAHRRSEGAEEILEAPTPVLITCDKGLVEPRIPALPKMMAAKKAPVEELAVGPTQRRGTARGARFARITPLPSRPACRFLKGEPEAAARELVRLLRDEAGAL